MKQGQWYLPARAAPCESSHTSILGHCGVLKVMKDSADPISSLSWALPPFWLLGRFPTPVSPVVSQWKDMIGTAFSLAIVGYVINLAMGRTLADKHGYSVDSNQVARLPWGAPKDTLGL